MNIDFLKILCCPKTGSDLKLIINEYSKNGSVERGVLISREGGYRYPIIKGIPRFVDKELYSDSFGYEWKKWSKIQFESKNVGKKMEGHTNKRFWGLTNFPKGELKDKIVVEFGCGPGRFLDIVRSNGGVAVGIDMSLAVESARENFKDDINTLIIQGDILNPPFKRDIFDMGYTIGVLHHTPDPYKGFEGLVEVIKKNGHIACCVYPKNRFYDYFSVKIHRKFINLTKPIFGNRLALIYSYFSAYFLYYLSLFMKKRLHLKRLTTFLEKHIFVNTNIPDVRWRVLDTFDAITPRYASTHTREEVEGWFRKSGCRNIKQIGWCPTSFCGIKE